MCNNRPSGWDNEKKIAILYDNIQSFSPDDQYNEVIVNNQQFVNVGLLFVMFVEFVYLFVKIVFDFF